MCGLTQLTMSSHTRQVLEVSNHEMPPPPPRRPADAAGEHNVHGHQRGLEGTLNADPYACQFNPDLDSDDETQPPLPESQQDSCGLVKRHAKAVPCSGFPHYDTQQSQAF